MPEASLNVHWIVVDRAIAKRRREDWRTRWVVHAVQAVAIGLLAAAAFKTSRQGTLLGQSTTFGLSCMSILLISPVGWGHYFVLGLPAVLFAPRWLWGRDRRGLAVVLAVTSALLPTVHYVAMRRVGDFGLLGLGTTAWFLTVCTLVLRLDPRPAIGRPWKTLSASDTMTPRARTRPQPSRGALACHALSPHPPTPNPHLPH